MNRKSLLIITLMLLMVAAFFAPEKQSDPVLRSTASAIQHNQKSTLSLDKKPSSGIYVLPDRSHLGQNISELFFTNSRPEIRARAVKQKPVAPELPYKYMGKMFEKDQWTIFLTRNDKPYVVHEGELLDYEYKVNAIRLPVLEFIYLPLNEKQTLLIGDN